MTAMKSMQYTARPAGQALQNMPADDMKAPKRPTKPVVHVGDITSQMNAHECPAKGKQCLKGQKFNHFARACKSKSHTQGKTVHRNVHAVQKEDEEFDLELFVDTVTAESDEEESAYADIRLGPQNRKLKFKLDTGAQTCVIPAKDFATLMPDTPLMADTHKLLAYGGHPLKVNGYCSLVGRYKDKSTTQKFYIVDCNGPPVLGYRACKNLGLIKVVCAVTDTSEGKCNAHSADILSEYSDIFKGIGEFQDECSFQIHPNVAPVVCPPRRVPFALRDRLKTELDNMEKDGIICKVTEPTQWINALVTCEKPQTYKLRVCLDPRPLNTAILRPYYPLPTLEDVTCKLAGAKYFSILDARSGYWAIKLSEELSLLTTFNTIFGR